MKKKKKIIIISSLVLSTLLILNGITPTSKNEEKITFTYTDEDYDNFVTWDEINCFYWYIIEIYDGAKNDVVLTKKTSTTKINDYLYQYYYTNVFENNKVYSVLFNKQEKTFWVETGPEIISAISLSDYLVENDLVKSSYSQDEINKIFKIIKENYNEKKELKGTGKVLIKDNSMY